MAYDLQQSTVGLRGEVVEEMIKQISAPTYKFKQAVAVVPTSDWSQTFFRENPAVLTAQSGNAIRGLPQGANFPQASVGFEKVTVRIVKFGLEENIPWEAIISGQINIQARTVIKITQAVVKAVDDEIWDGLTESRAPVLISSFEIGVGVYGGHWDEASAAIVNNLMNASRLIAEQNYDVGDLMCFVSPKDKQSIMNFIVNKGSQFPSLATGVAENGRIGTLAGITLVESNSVTASWALVCKPKTCATWKELVPLRSVTVEDPLKSWKIRIAEEGVLELTDPKCIVLIKNTQSA